ncbi:MAG: hypothetical protein II748_00005, partial [Clostridia bacterium]|nr:hypothetical protein [Clostridia bacterium]
KTYYVSVWVKVSEDFAMNTGGFNGIGIGIGTGGGWEIRPDGCSIVNSNDNLPYKWTQFKGEFTPAEDMTGLFSIFCWGKTAGQVWFDDAYLGTDPVPEIEYPEEPEEPEDKYVACGNAEVLIIAEEDVIVIEDIIPAEADNTVNLCIPDITDNDYTDLFVSQDAFEKILEAVGEDGTLTIDYGPFCLVFDAKAVEYIRNSTDGGDIDIDAVLYEEDGEVCLDIDIYEYIEDDEGNYEYLPFHEFGEGTVTAKIAFEIPEGTSADDYKVFVLSGDGRIPVEATFAEGICEFALPHLSTFVIAYNPQTSDASFAIAIAIVMTFCLAVVVIKRKRVTSK